MSTPCCIVEVRDVVLAGPGSEPVLLEQNRQPDILVEAQQGPPGPPGVSYTYVHEQTLAAAVWTVPHNMNKYPAVSVVDHLDNLLIADVFYVDDSIVRVTHSTATIGRVFCN